MCAERDHKCEGTSSKRTYCEGPVGEWNVNDVQFWATSIKKYSPPVVGCLREQNIDGVVLLELTEKDIRSLKNDYNYGIKLGELKRLWLDIKEIQMIIKGSANIEDHFEGRMRDGLYSGTMHCGSNRCRFETVDELLKDCCADKIPHEYFKTVIALTYSLLVTWITSFVMVIVHERVPDMQRYPPLPDIFLDNIPRIPWAFHCTEITGVILFIMWTIVCIFHKYRLVLLRRFFALCGSVFLIRCITMLITSLSVPGSHLQCQKLEYVLENENMELIDIFKVRIARAYHIWSGMGLTIKGVQTCGDYMYSGHTVALTLLNFFLTEYTPRTMYVMHTFTWLLNLFGVFFILAAHEHYSIDVFIAFYITSRLFLYYHTLANNHTNMSLDATRSKLWFPIFYYLEQSVDGYIPNEYDSFSSLYENIKFAVIYVAKILSFKLTSLWNFIKRYRGISRSASTRLSFQTSIGTSTSFQQAQGSLPKTYFQKQARMPRQTNSFLRYDSQ